jgi:hypothetical protein
MPSKDMVAVARQSKTKAVVKTKVHNATSGASHLPESPAYSEILKGWSSASAKASTSPLTVGLPAKLQRPTVRAVNQAALAAVDASLADTPAQYVRDRLTQTGAGSR